MAKSQQHPSSRRTASLSRKTKETEISLSLNLDGTGHSEIATTVGFFDHMLTHLAKHSLIDLSVSAKGDTHIDDHHTVEDISLVLGSALDQALGDKAGIFRYGWAAIPMEDTLANVALDLSGRPAFVFNVQFPSKKIGAFDVELVHESLRSLANTAKMNLHINVPYGDNSHHIAEAIFKALAKSLRQAITPDPRAQGAIPSTKGTL
ncbi:MAG TPA: imidazoleglycerol-phosphate dehydratase HisB [Phycisphaerae bacterium]|nr:imidazoleglycerol-phosphate dehydratase HisB [Phycisphaerae bacterium]